MKKRKLFFAFLALFFGVIIFTSSLLLYSQKETAGSDKLTKKKLYFGEKILPDHIFYPLLMIADRSLLSLTNGESKVFLRISLAQDRLISSQKLLLKGEEALALSTMTKSQKYLILASHELFSQSDVSKEAKEALYKALQDNTNNLAKMEKSFSTIPTDPIGDLITESKALLIVIQNKIQQ